MGSVLLVGMGCPGRSKRGLHSSESLATGRYLFVLALTFLYSSMSYTDYGHPDRIWNVNDWRRDILSELHRTHRLGMDGTIVVSNSAACQAVLRAILDAQKAPVAHVAGLLMFSPGVWLTLDYMERAVPGSVKALKSGQVLQHPCTDSSLKINVDLQCLIEFEKVFTSLWLFVYRIQNCVCRLHNHVPITCPVRIVHGSNDPVGA